METGSKVNSSEQCFQSFLERLHCALACRRWGRSRLRVQHSPPEGWHARRPSSRGPWDSLHAECWCPPQSLEEILRVVGAWKQTNTSQQWNCQNVKWRAAELHCSHQSGWRSRTRPEPPEAWLGPRRRSSWLHRNQHQHHNKIYCLSKALLNTGFPQTCSKRNVDFSVVKRLSDCIDSLVIVRILFEKK